jgi:hypothetical protein
VERVAINDRRAHLPIGSPRRLGRRPPLHEQTLAARRWVLGDDHPNTLDSMKFLATIRRELVNYSHGSTFVSLSAGWP